MISKLNKSGFLGGTIWTTLSFVVVTIVYLLRISILTRYLDKADFGLVAIVLFVLGFTNIFADLGVSTSLLSQKNVSRKEYSSLYWGGLILAIILYILISFTSPLFAIFYEHDELNLLIPIMGLDLIISSIGRQFSVFKQKEFKFKQLALIKIVSEFFSLIVAVVLAVNGYGIWSLIISLLTTSIVNSVLNFIIGYKSHPLIFCLNFKETEHLYRIGFYKTGSQIFDYISSQIDILILGKLLPMGDMGVYSIVKGLVLRIYSSFNQVITKVAIPYFAKFDLNSRVFVDKYLYIVYVVSAINSIIYSTIIVSSKETLYLFYGKSYVEYDYLLGILCVWGIFSSILNCASVIIVVSTGRTDLGFKWTQVRLIINPIFIFIGGYFFGMLGIAISQTIYSLISVFIYRKIVISKILPDLNFHTFFMVFKKLIVMFVLILSILFFVNQLLLTKIDNPYLILILNIIMTLVLYQVTLGKDILYKIKNLKHI